MNGARGLIVDPDDRPYRANGIFSGRTCVDAAEFVKLTNRVTLGMLTVSNACSTGA
jgi:hypothetical protein